MDKSTKQVVMLKDMEISAGDGDLTYKFKKDSPIPVVEETEDKLYVYAIASDKDGIFNEKFSENWIKMYGKAPRVFFNKDTSTAVRIQEFKEI